VSVVGLSGSRKNHLQKTLFGGKRGKRDVQIRNAELAKVMSIMDDVKYYRDITTPMVKRHHNYATLANAGRLEPPTEKAVNVRGKRTSTWVENDGASAEEAWNSIRGSSELNTVQENKMPVLRMSHMDPKLVLTDEIDINKAVRRKKADLTVVSLLDPSNNRGHYILARFQAKWIMFPVVIALGSWKNRHAENKTKMRNAILEILDISRQMGDRGLAGSLLAKWKRNAIYCEIKIKAIKAKGEHQREGRKFAEEFLSVVDQDGDGALSYCELAWCMKAGDLEDDRFAKAAKWLTQGMRPGIKFKKYDIDDNGTIEFEMLVEAMVEYCASGWQYELEAV